MIYDTMIRKRKQRKGDSEEESDKNLNDDDVMKGENADDAVTVRNLLETLVSGGFECGKVKPRFHPFRGQQVDVNNLPTLLFYDEEVKDIIFPPTGFDFFSTKYMDTTAFNTASGYLIRDRPAHVVNYVQDIDITAPESVVFQVVTETSVHFLRWSHLYIEWLMEEEELGYYRLEDERWVSFSRSVGNNCAEARTMSSNVQKDLIINVDGVGLIAPRCPMSVYEVKNGHMLDNVGNIYGKLEVLDGLYLCNNNNKTMISRWYGKPDSPQQIMIMNEKVWTIPKLLHHWTFPNMSQRVQFKNVNYFEDWMDTLTRDTFQMKKNVSRLQDSASRQDVVHNYMQFAKVYSEYSLNCFMANNFIVRKNILYMTYRWPLEEGLISYNGLFFSRQRTMGHRIYVKKKIKGVEVGWWYQVI